MIELTPALAKLCLDVHERRNRYPATTIFPCSVLAEALLIQEGKAPPVYQEPPKYRELQAGLKRPNWKHEKGVERPRPVDTSWLKK